jgi:hypothetical protein
MTREMSEDLLKRTHVGRLGCAQGSQPYVVPISVAVVTAVAVKTEGVDTPVEKPTGDSIKVRVDQFDGLAKEVFH